MTEKGEFVIAEYKSTCTHSCTQSVSVYVATDTASICMFGSLE